MEGGGSSEHVCVIIHTINSSWWTCTDQMAITFPHPTPTPRHTCISTVDVFPEIYPRDPQSKTLWLNELPPLLTQGLLDWTLRFSFTPGREKLMPSQWGRICGCEGKTSYVRRDLRSFVFPLPLHKTVSPIQERILSSGFVYFWRPSVCPETKVTVVCCCTWELSCHYPPTHPPTSDVI